MLYGMRSALKLAAIILGAFLLIPLRIAAQETIRIDTALVSLPVIVSDRNDVYIGNLRKEEFQIFEDGKLQELTFFANLDEAFSVVLMIDTSGSTIEKLGQIRTAASAFVDQLRGADQMKIISFDDEVRDWGGFTKNRTALKRSISELQPGKGTRLYDAMRLAFASFANVTGRKAIVIFSDGVDFKSSDTSAEDNFRNVEESGIIIYPIRYSTRVETEAIARQQQAGGGAVVLSQVIKGTPTGTTPTTVPGETRVPSIRRGGVTDRIGTPPLDPRRNPGDPGPDRMPNGRFPDANTTRGGSVSGSDGVSAMLDYLYKTADQYLGDLANKTGGRLLRADNLEQLPDAFSKIATELRTQYSLGYYPVNQMHTGRFRRVQVKVDRKDAVVRTRPGYREPKD